MLPNGVEPGRVKIVNMENSGVPSLSNVASGKNSPSANTTQTSDSTTSNSNVDSVPQSTPRSTGKFFVKEYFFFFFF